MGACQTLLRSAQLAMSCEHSTLIGAIHRNLPYFTNNPFEDVNLSNATITVENILEDVLVYRLSVHQCNQVYIAS